MIKFPFLYRLCYFCWKNVKKIFVMLAKWLFLAEVKFDKINYK